MPACGLPLLLSHFNMLTFPHFTPHFSKSMWSLPQVLEFQASTIPDTPFLQWTDKSPALSYAETNRRANRLAHGLAALGVKKGRKLPRQEDS